MICTSNAARCSAVAILCIIAGYAKPGSCGTVEGAAAVEEAGAGSAQAVLREGTPVLLTFAAALSSRTAEKGGTVDFLLADDIRVGGVTVAKAGCKVVGRVTYVKKAAVPGHSGALSLRLEYLQTGDKQFPLRPSKEKGGKGEVPYSRPYRLKWPLGLFRSGDDVEIGQGTVLAVYVAEDISLSAAE